MKVSLPTRCSLRVSVTREERPAASGKRQAASGKVTGLRSNEAHECHGEWSVIARPRGCGRLVCADSRGALERSGRQAGLGPLPFSGPDIIQGLSFEPRINAGS